MLKKIDKIYCLLLIVLCLNSILYLHNVEGNPVNPKIENSPLLEDEALLPTIEEGIGDIETNAIINDTIITTGNYKLQGFFTHDSFVDLDSNGYVFEWENYDVMRYSGTSSVEARFRQYTTSGTIGTFWHTIGTFGQLRSEQHINSEHIYSTIFSPEFTYETKIQGRVFFYVKGDVWPSAYNHWDLRITLESFNPVTEATTPITSTTNYFNDGEWTYWANIPDVVTIPAGYRLRTTYEVRLQTGTFRTGTENNVELRTGTKDVASQVTWQIDSGDTTNSTYYNTYIIEDIVDVFGMQVLMYQDKYPTIDITGFQNNTIYYNPTNATVSISDSVSNSYKWDSESYTSFSSPLTVSLPEELGWHTLSIKAQDFYDNTAEAVIRVGYDPYEFNIILNSPANNSIVTDGMYLNFSAYDSTQITYEWDKNTEKIILPIPYDLPLSRGFNGIHQLTIEITHTFGIQSFEYFFFFDNFAPVITLTNVVNQSTYAQGKNIDIQITDSSTPIDVSYKWDNDSYASWSPIDGSLYRTYLPITEGLHNLTVLANDTFGLVNTKVYSFTTSLSILLVELKNMLNNTYYMGGNTVEITIANDNDTIKYFWNDDSPTIGIIVDNVLTLSGPEGLSTIAGTYKLTILVGDILNVEFDFQFIFIVDTLAPTVVQVIPFPSYNQSRFLTSQILSYTIQDNATSSENLIVLYSFDNLDNKSFTTQFDLSLSTLIDGSHNLTIYVRDIAGNYYLYYIEFIIDTTIPSSTVTIVGQAITPDNKRYVPASTTILVSISDADPIINSYYSWNESSYILFVDSFVLPSVEGYARLIVLANDSLGNTRTRIYWLTVDTSAPTVTLDYILNNSKINIDTPLQFLVEDINDDTIDIIETQWDVESSPTSRNPSFDAGLLADYISLSEAEFSIYTKDIVGNEYYCVYHFELDFTAPEFSLIGTANNSYVRGYSLLDFDVSSLDIFNFLFSWDTELDYAPVLAPWDIHVPIVDGVHTLYLRLEDDTGMGTYPNYVTAVYVFIVDDLEMNYILPNDFDDGYQYSMFYGESFQFVIDIKDRINETIIADLQAAIITGDLKINLLTDWYNISTTYYFTISGTNITNDLFTDFQVQFWQFEGNIQIIDVYVKVDRQLGQIEIASLSSTITYEENITFTFQLFDDTHTFPLIVNFVSINNNYQDITYTLIDAGQYIYQITFASDEFTNQKGTFEFEIYLESNFYYGIKSDTQSITVTIQPVPIMLSVNVSSVEIIYDNNLVVFASLTRADGTPIQFARITFCFYIYYKGSSHASASTGNVLLAVGYDLNFNDTAFTDDIGEAEISFKMTDDIDYVIVKVVYEGSLIYDPTEAEYSANIFAISGGLSRNMIIIIAASTLIFIIALSFVIYRVVRARPFEELMEKVSDEEIEAKTAKVSPGVILSIFDQSKGPIPLIGKHSLETDLYRTRMRIGVENFLLKICDQAYSSLGFEEHDDRRRIGSINLPNEDMVGFIHGVQLPNKTMRGGFENLSLIVLADAEAGGLLLANQEFMFPEIDELIESLKEKRPLMEIEIILEKIRRRSVIIMLAAIKNAKKDKTDLKKYA